MLGVCFLVSLHVPPVFIDPHVSPITPCLCPYVSHTCLNISICISICMFLSGSVCHCILCTCLCSNIGGPLTHLDPLQVHQGEELQDVVSSNQEDAKAPTMTSLKSLGLPQPGFHSLILDLSTLSFVDTVCIKSLKNVRDCRQARAPQAFMLILPLASHLLATPPPNKPSPLSSPTKPCPIAASLRPALFVAADFP
jgi:hypothetical protein